MGIQTPNGFNLDNSGKRVVVDPLTAPKAGAVTMER